METNKIFVTNFVFMQKNDNFRDEVCILDKIII